MFTNNCVLTPIIVCFLVCLSLATPIACAAEDDLRVEGIDGPVFEILDTQDAVWIAAANGVFRWNHGLPQSPSLQRKSTGVYEIADAPDAVWFGTDEGLLRFAKGSNGSPQLVQAIPEVYAVETSENTVWVGTNRSGLYRWEKGSRPFPILSPFEASWINDVLAVDTTVWIAAQTGLYVLDRRSRSGPRRLSVLTGAVYKVRRAGNSLWIAAENGLFRSTLDSRLPPARVNLDTGWVNDIYDAGEAVWFGAQKGVFTWSKTTGTAPPRRTSINLKRVYSVRESRCCIWLGTEASLFRWNKNEGSTPIPQLLNVGKIYTILESGTTVWVGSDNGLFRIEKPDIPWAAAIVASKLPREIVEGQDIVLRWQLVNPGWRIPRSLVSQRVLIFDTNGQQTNTGVERVERGRFDFVVSGLPPGTYNVRIEATDFFDHVVRSSPLLLKIRYGTAHQAMAIVKYTGVAYAVINVLAFVILTVGARWSYRCFMILTDPTVRMLSLYFGIALKYVSPVRIWVFQRYYVALQSEFRPAEYLPCVMARPDGSSLSTTEMRNEITDGGRVWIQGPSGSGKTELTRELMRQYTGPKTLRRAWKANHYVPILVPLRNFTARSAVEIIGDALAAHKVPFEDAFLRGLLRAGGFLLIFDGLNESNSEADILQFSHSYPTVRVIVTTQTAPVSDDFDHYSLPLVSGQFARSLLQLFVPKVTPLQRPSESSELWDDLESAYDVRLIADLIMNRQRVPSDRLQLYGAALNHATLVGLSDAGRAAASRLAWNLWKAGQYRFPESDEVTADMLLALRKATIVVRRQGEYEFRHDLMRGYLAASWVSTFAASWEVSVDRLSEEEVWNLSGTEQHTVFPFIAALTSTADELEQVFSFAADLPGVRQQLLVAAVKESKKRGYGWSVGERQTGTQEVS